MIGKKIETEKDIHYAATVLPSGSKGTVLRRGIDGWIVAFDEVGELWLKEYEMKVIGEAEPTQIPNGIYKNQNGKAIVVNDGKIIGMQG